MPSLIPAPSRDIAVEPLTESSFAPFGHVIQNPALSPYPTTKNPQTTANQGTALKYIDVANLINYYNLSPSKKPAKSVINMFVCSPRKLRARKGKAKANVNTDRAIEGEGEKLFDVKILERHPFTSQTFVPLGLSAEDRATQYLVIVAPTLPVSKSRKDSTNRPKPYPTPERPTIKRSLFDVFSRARPSPFTNERSPPTPAKTSTPGRPKGPGLPDLSSIRAFLADGSQAVTYGAGTWHAPMVVLGEKDVGFVVVQYVNGVNIEDCQEIELRGDGGQEGLSVVIELGNNGSGGGSRARL
jgi:ureidoglycolate lyase